MLVRDFSARAGADIADRGLAVKEYKLTQVIRWPQRRTHWWQADRQAESHRMEVQEQQEKVLIIESTAEQVSRHRLD